MNLKTHIFPWRLLRLPALLAGLLGLCHCGPDVGAICDNRRACIGGNDKDVDACILDFDALADVADSLGCSAEYSDYFLCFEDNASCQTQDQGGQCMTVNDCPNADADESFACVGGVCKRSYYGLPTNNNGQDGPCEAEQNAFNRCL